MPIKKHPRQSWGSALAQYWIEQRWFVLIMTLVVAAAGAGAWFNLPIDAFPDVTNNQVMILTQAPGLSSLDMEEQVTFPIEGRMGGLPDVLQVRSISKGGLSQVVVIFRDGVDTYFARQLVFERLQEAKEFLPAGVEPELAPVTTGLGEIFQYTIEGGGLSAMELRTLQDWVVAPRLRPLPGVTEVNSFGGFAKQYQIYVRPDALVKYGVTLDEIEASVDRNNANAGGKFINRGWEQFYLRGVGFARSERDLERIVVAARGGIPILLSDLADVAIGHSTRQGAVTRDGRGECVAGMVMMLKGANSKEVVERVKTEIPRIEKSLPAGTRINVFYDRTFLIGECIRTVVSATTEGGICVIFVLFLFLAEWRTAFIVVLSLPLTFLATFLVMGWAGITSNLMSLGGLAFSVGMVVDATVVVVENARRLLANAQRRGRLRIVADAVLEVARPVAGSVGIIALVLLPLFTLEGLEGKMFGPLALTMLISILLSLVVALLVMPAWSYFFLPEGAEREFGFIHRINHAYRRLLAGAILHRGKVIAAASLLFAASLFLVPLIGTEFMPPLDEGALAINAVRLPNASLEGAVKTADEIERRLTKLGAVAAVVSKTGRAEISEDPMGPEQTDIMITFKPRAEWPAGLDRATLYDAVRKELEAIPGLRYSFSQPIALRVNELISGVKSDVAVKLFGDDLDQLTTFATEAAGIIEGTAGAVDVKAAQLSGMTQIDVEIDREAASRYGVNVGDINELIGTAVGGKVISTLIEGQRRFPIELRYPESARRDEAALARLLVHTKAGEQVQLGEVATIRRIETPIEVGRENGRRRLVVECNVKGRDLGNFIADLKERLAPLEGKLPSGYYISYGGQFENQQRAMKRLGIVVPVDLALIFILLVVSLGRLTDALLVILNLPFALVGGVIALVLARMTASVSVAVAFIVLLGIAVQNGVILVAFIRQLRNEGNTVIRSAREGCRLRFRPLMMTALTSWIGHMPMLWAIGSGAEIQKPLAVVVMGGLVTSTALTLIVMPAMFVAMEQRFGNGPAVPGVKPGKP